LRADNQKVLLAVKNMAAKARPLMRAFSTISSEIVDDAPGLKMALAALWSAQRDYLVIMPFVRDITQPVFVNF
jgi:hypothetical protein